MMRRTLTCAAVAAFALTMYAGTPAHAARVTFRYRGGRWSHHRHSGWHRYWGGPSIGFYWAAAPVYVVAGYGNASYYNGPTFWTSNPSFGISINLGGGGGWHGGGRGGGGWHGGGGGDGRPANFHNGGGHGGGSFHGGGGHSGGGGHGGGGRSGGGGHAGGGGHDHH